MEVEALLEARAVEARARIEDLQRNLQLIMDSADTATDDEHDPEGTTAFDRAQAQSLLDGARAQLEEIAAARERLRDGDYGICETCGRPIPAERLAARPSACQCVDCAARGGG